MPTPSLTLRARVASGTGRAFARDGISALLLEYSMDNQGLSDILSQTQVGRSRACRPQHLVASSNGRDG